MTGSPEPETTSSGSSSSSDSAGSSGGGSSSGAGPLGPERRGVLGLDENPDVSRFVGVWFEQADAARWVVDYRAHKAWRGFLGREVIVTGECYGPLYSAINRPHFQIATLRLVDAAKGRGPYLSMGPELLLRGALVDVAAPAGSKAAGSSRLVFNASDGTEYTVIADDPLTTRGRVTLRGRVLVPDMSYVARTGDLDLWVVEVDGADLVDSTRKVPPTTPCP